MTATACGNVNAGTAVPNKREEDTMTDFQERVVTERKELYDKCEKLNAFITGSPIYKTLPVDEQVRLRMQLMKEKP